MNKTNELLKPYRARIDAVDDQILDLLAKRVGIIREVGELKYRENIPSVLPERVEEVREGNVKRGQERGLDGELIRDLYHRIIGYSCDLEDEIKDQLSKTEQTITG